MARGQTTQLALLNVQRLQTDKFVILACQDNLAFMRSLPDESIKLIVTSPPYNIGKSYERRSSLDQYVQEQAIAR